jgi:hypothetical protein
MDAEIERLADTHADETAAVAQSYG